MRYKKDILYEYIQMLSLTEDHSKSFDLHVILESCNWKFVKQDLFMLKPFRLKHILHLLMTQRFERIETLKIT